MAKLLRLPGGKKNHGNKNREGKYYARIYIPRTGQRPKAKLIPLKTENTREAAIRFQQVQEVEHLIKQNIDFTFPWLNGSPTAVKQISFQDAAER